MQDVFFLKPFYSAPVLIVTPSHNYTSGTMIKKKGGGKIATSVDPKNNALTTWVEVGHQTLFTGQSNVWAEAGCS